MTSLTTANGAASALQLDAAGQIVTTQSLDGQVQSVSYDDRGYESSIAVGNRSAEMVNDLLGRPLRTTFSSGLRFDNQYDALGNLTQQTIGNSVVTQAFDATGRLVEQVNAQGERTTFRYDAVGNLLEERFEQTGATRAYEYDAAGRRVGASVTNLDSHAELDAAGRVTHITFTDGSTESFSYDDVGNVIERRARDGLTFKYSYNALNEVEEVIDPLGNVTQYGFDGSDRADSYTDALGRVTEIAMDSLGNRLLKRLPLGQSTTSAYDDAGMPTQRTGYDGEVQLFEYDELRRLTSVTNQAGDLLESRSYPTETMSTVTTRYGVTSIATSPLGQLLNLTSVNGLASDYEYSTTNELTAITTAFGSTDVELTALRGTSRIVTPELNEINLTYDADGQLLETNYSTGYRRTQVNDNFTLPISYSYENASGQTLLQRDLTRDTGDRITTVTDEAGNVHSYEYDGLGQLQRETLRDDAGDVNRMTDYEYDLVGNLIRTVSNGVEVVRSYDANDRLVASGDWTVESDATGNMTRRIDGATVETFEYDEFQKLTRFKRTGVDPVEVQYGYDDDGLIATRTVDGVQMH